MIPSLRQVCPFSVHHKVCGAKLVWLWMNCSSVDGGCCTHYLLVNFGVTFPCCDFYDVLFAAAHFCRVFFFSFAPSVNIPAVRESLYAFCSRFLIVVDKMFIYIYMYCYVVRNALSGQ